MVIYNFPTYIGIYYFSYYKCVTKAIGYLMGMYWEVLDAYLYPRRVKYMYQIRVRH